MISYTTQPILPPYLFSHYEMVPTFDKAYKYTTLLDAIRDPSTVPHPATTSNSDDFSGVCFPTYMSILHVCNDLISIFKFVSLHNKQREYMPLLVKQNHPQCHFLVHQLHSLWHTLMTQAQQFQFNSMVSSWNPTSKNLSHFLALSTSPYDEQHKSELGKIVLHHARIAW